MRTSLVAVLLGFPLLFGRAAPRAPAPGVRASATSPSPKRMRLEPIVVDSEGTYVDDSACVSSSLYFLLRALA